MQQNLCSPHGKVWGGSSSGTSQQGCSYPSWAQGGGWAHLQCYLLLPCALLTSVDGYKEGSGDPLVTVSSSIFLKWCQERAFSCLSFSTLKTQECWSAFCLVGGDKTGFFWSDLPAGCTLCNLFVAWKCDTKSWKVKQDCHLVLGKILLSLQVITFSD